MGPLIRRDTSGHSGGRGHLTRLIGCDGKQFFRCIIEYVLIDALNLSVVMVIVIEYSVNP